MPKATTARASNAWEATEAAAPAVVVTAPAEAVGAVDAAPLRADAEVKAAPAVEWPPGSVPAAAQDAEALSPADVAAGYTDLTFAELRAEAKARGLPAGGSAVELAARLAEHDAAQAT
jgi:hypothetical protein